VSYRNLQDAAKLPNADAELIQKAADRKKGKSKRLLDTTCRIKVLDHDNNQYYVLCTPKTKESKDQFQFLKLCFQAVTVKGVGKWTSGKVSPYSRIFKCVGFPMPFDIKGKIDPGHVNLTNSPLYDRWWIEGGKANQALQDEACNTHWEQSAPNKKEERLLAFVG
jgi:hypothetical protein